MSTRAIVGMKLDDGSYLSVYTHWDGYPSHHLPILEKYYDTTEKVAALLSNGDISVLDTLCDGVYGHTFDNPAPNQTIYYGRDRGDKGTKAKPHSTKNRFRDEKYGYCFENGEWSVFSN